MFSNLGFIIMKQQLAPGPPHTSPCSCLRVRAQHLQNLSLESHFISPIILSTDFICRYLICTPQFNILKCCKNDEAFFMQMYSLTRSNIFHKTILTNLHLVQGGLPPSFLVTSMLIQVGHPLLLYYSCWTPEEAQLCSC